MKFLQPYPGSEHFACRVVGSHRSTHRHDCKVIDIEKDKLQRCLGEIAAEQNRREPWLAYCLQGLGNYKRVHNPDV